MFPKKFSRTRYQEWYSVEYCRSAQINKILPKNNHLKRWDVVGLRNAGNEICLPYGLLSSQPLFPEQPELTRYPYWMFTWSCDEGRPNQVATRILRPSWTIGQRRQVMFQQRVSVFKRTMGEVPCGTYHPPHLTFMLLISRCSFASSSSGG